MLQLNVILVATSPAETIHIEESLQSSGYLAGFKCVSLAHAMTFNPNWRESNLVIARGQENNGKLLSLLAPILRDSTPPVFFLIDHYIPELVVSLQNAGASRVLPLNEFARVIKPCLESVFGGKIVPELQPAPRNQMHFISNQIFNKQFSIQDERLARLFKESSIGICVFRINDQRCVDCNDSFAQLIGWQRNELIGRNLYELVIPSDAVEKIARGEVLSFEQKFFTHTHLLRYVQIHLDIVQLESEDYYVALVEDTTEQVQSREKIKRLNYELERTVQVRTGALNAANIELAAEIGRRKALEDFTNQLSQTLRETTDFVAISGPDGKLQFLNKAGRSLLNLSEEASISHLSVFFLYTEKMQRIIQTEIQPQLIKNGTWKGETEFILPDGRNIPISQVLLCRKDDSGNVMYYATLARDISDFKRVEQELRRSRELYRTLAEAAHDFIFMVSIDGKMEYANEFACRALGHSANTIEGMPAWKFFPDQFAFDHQQLFGDVFQKNHPVYTEGQFNREDDQYWLGTWLVPIQDQHGKHTSILGISRDITQQKQTDAALQKALETERSLAEIRSNLFSMTSHQFRTPLSTILLSAELLLKYGTKWDEAKRNEQLGRVLDAARRLNSMLEDILIISRTESGRYYFTPSNFDLVTFTQKIIDEITLNDQEKHVIEFQHQDEEVLVYLDREVYRRIVDNLLSNAIKYSPSNSIVSILVNVEENHILLEVTDQGIGIPENDLNSLFQPFQRGSNAGKIPGTGIGLSIIRKSIEQMNGTVSVRSIENKGTTFSLRFPARIEDQ